MVVKQNGSIVLKSRNPEKTKVKIGTINKCQNCLRENRKLRMLIRSHDAIQFGHVGNAVNCAWTVRRLRIRICVRTLYATLRICNECVYFISRFHDLTFRNAIAGNHCWSSVCHLATRFWRVWFGSGRIVAHMQQRNEAKHFIWHG